MDQKNYDDPEVEDHWCAQQRLIVADYLSGHNIPHRRIGDWPAWHVAPHVSIWAVESLARPEWIGCWVICGDLPTDCVSAAEIEPPQHPKKAVRSIAERWMMQAEAWREGQDFEAIKVLEPYSHEELAPLLASRAQLLLEWTETPWMWED